MNHKSFPQAAYASEIERLNSQLDLLKKKKNIISWTRFAVILLLAAALYYLYPISFLYAAIAAVLLIAAFIRLVILAVNNNTRIDNHNRLLAINQNEINITAGDYLERPDGANFLLPQHPYAKPHHFRTGQCIVCGMVAAPF
jgi:hypothetical protein